MGNEILCLDSNKSRAVLKALSKHGKVSHVKDTNQALFLIAERDFQYYFVDADTPQAQAFLKHLRHDPQLAPPSATVLLTNNEEEDCAAWSVDTFVTRSRAGEDIPYIFSHLRGRPEDPENVLRIAPRDETKAAKAAGSSGGPRLESPFGVEADGGEPEPADREEVNAAGAETAGRGPACNGSKLTASAREDKAFASSSGSGGRYRYAAVALLLIASGLWLFVWGPFAAGNKSTRLQSDGRKVEAESSRRSNQRSWFVIKPSDYLQPGASAQQSAPPAAPSGDVPGAIAQPPPPASRSSIVETEKQKEPVVQPPVANRSPSVSISGPTLVHVGEAVTYHANASDPDGGPLSCSWGGTSKSTAFQNTGTYPISVSVTDPGGLSASDTIMVTVMQ